MKEGAFALIDCLGFKGIWSAIDPSILIDKLSRIEETISQDLVASKLPIYNKYGPIQSNVRLLSDTVAISLQFSDNILEEEAKGILITYMCYSVAQVLDIFIGDEPSLVLRGCISYGLHISRGNFIVGPAVDEAAEHMNIAEGAFIWLLPNAAEFYKRFIDNYRSTIDFLSPDKIHQMLLDIEGDDDLKDKYIQLFNNIYKPLLEVVTDAMNYVLILPIVIDPYCMPIKNGYNLTCAVINPLLIRKNVDVNPVDIINKYKKIMSGKSLNIWLKHQNTITFLEYAAQITSDFKKYNDELGNRLINSKDDVNQVLVILNTDKTIIESYNSAIDKLITARKLTMMN